MRFVHAPRNPANAHVCADLHVLLQVRARLLFSPNRTVINASLWSGFYLIISFDTM